MIQFTIDLPPRSKKNSQKIVVNKKTGRPFIMYSDAYKAYRKAALALIHMNGAVPISEPVNVKCVYYMPTRRACDLTNLLEATDDILVDAGVLADDNYNVVGGHDGSRVLVDKDHPRTEITITKLRG